MERYLVLAQRKGHNIRLSLAWPKIKAAQQLYIVASNSCPRTPVFIENLTEKQANQIVSALNAALQDGRQDVQECIKLALDIPMTTEAYSTADEE